MRKRAIPAFQHHRLQLLNDKKAGESLRIDVLLSLNLNTELTQNNLDSRTRHLNVVSRFVHLVQAPPYVTTQSELSSQLLQHVTVGYWGAAEVSEMQRKTRIRAIDFMIFGWIRHK
jgi:hypothetical protein